MAAEGVVRVVARTASTQTDLVAAAAAEPDRWPHLSALRAERQTAGRGRAGRGWDTQDLVALTASVVLRPAVPPDRWTWVPLLAGLAVVRSAGLAGAGLKWPNDVVVPAPTEQPGWGAWRKVGGVLAEVVPGRGGSPAAVVVGIGVNLAGPPPVPWASTLDAAGAPPAALEPAALLEAVRDALGGLLDATGPERWRALVEPVCVTVGQRVRVHGVRAGPGGPAQETTGVATGLDDDGALLVRDDGQDGRAGRVRRVLSGDVLHLRTSGWPAR